MSPARLRLLVCGGRDFTDRAAAFAALDRAHAKRPVAHVIHGGAKGADSLAHEWALARAVPVTVYPADWNAHGKGAGPIRNQRMLAEASPDAVVAFAGGRGTADMIARAKAAGLPVWEVPA